MMYWRMVFGDIVTFVVASWCPIVAKLLLSYSTAEPVVFHIHGLEFFHNIVVDYSERRGVVSLHRCGGLGVAQEFECVSCWDGFMAIDVQCSYLGFSYR